MLRFTRSFPIPATKEGSWLCLSYSASSGFAEFSFYSPFKSLLLLLSSLVMLEEFQLPLRIFLQKNGLFLPPPIQATPSAHPCTDKAQLPKLSMLPRKNKTVQPRRCKYTHNNSFTIQKCSQHLYSIRLLEHSQYLPAITCGGQSLCCYEFAVST